MFNFQLDVVADNVGRGMLWTYLYKVLEVIIVFGIVNMYTKDAFKNI